MTILTDQTIRHSAPMDRCLSGQHRSENVSGRLCSQWRYMAGYMSVPEIAAEDGVDKWTVWHHISGRCSHGTG